MTTREIRDYHQILSADIPDFIGKYLHAPQLERLGGIGLLCGTDYSRLYRHRYFYSRLDHSLCAARIVWHFTGDPKQTLAALFHDIATPVFSHSVDFMHGDAATQTSTEARTRTILMGSPVILQGLRQDGITLSQVEDYHVYPVADNDSPRLSADRLEYTFSTMLVWHGGWSPADIAFMYGALAVLINEEGRPEIGFTTSVAAEQFVEGSCRVCLSFLKNDNKLSLQYLGDLLALALRRGVISDGDLYTLTEAQAIHIFENTDVAAVRDAWAAYTRIDQVHGAGQRPQAGYCIAPAVKVKRRYINPLVCADGKTMRIADASQAAGKQIDALLAFEAEPFGYIDFSFPD